MVLSNIVTPVVLAGGKSSRMGGNKSFVFLNNKRLIDTIIDLLQTVFNELEIILVTNSPEDYKYLQARLVEDIIRHKGPLGGLHTALTHSSTSYVFIFGCDMPFINPSLISYMVERLEGEDIVIPRIDGSLEPLHAIYSKNCLPKILKYLDQDNPRLDVFFHEAKIKYIEKEEIQIFDPLLKSFANINTRADLMNAESFLQND